MSLFKHLEKVENFEDISIDHEAEHDGIKIKDIFCDHWDTAKFGLELFQKGVKNPFMKIVIGIVVHAGDSFAKKLCD